jgi:hypothetical protein
MEIAPDLQTFTQCLQPMHLDLVHCVSGKNEMLSGLWHQAQERVQPLKKTVVLMPGPSSVDILCILSISAFWSLS